MKKSFIVLLAAMGLVAGNATAQIVTELDDIQFWFGTGSNRAALVLDFHYGGSESAVQESWVWGYRWDGTATGSDMLLAVAAGDTNLEITDEFFVSVVNYVVAINTYERESDFIDDVSWGYYIAGGRSTIFSNDFPFDETGEFDAPNGGEDMPATGQWSISTSGAADRTLADESWDAWSFGPYNETTFVHETPPSTTAYAAVPEPTSFLLVALGLALLGCRRQRCS